MQGNQDTASFIKSFTGSHHFVLDYLMEEVLQQQSESVQAFLLRTSILDRLCGPLCDAVLGISCRRLRVRRPWNISNMPTCSLSHWITSGTGTAITIFLRDLLRQRLGQSLKTEAIAEHHIRASQWYEDHGLELEAFHHAAAANDVERAARLIEGKGIHGKPDLPLYFRGVLVPVLNWLASLPKTVLDARPLLWTTYASVSLATGQPAGVEQKLQAAETAIAANAASAAILQGAEPDDKTRDLIGRIAAIRATLAIYQNQVETIICQSRRALEYLHPDNLAFRTFTTWKLAVAYDQQGNRVAAGQAYTEALAIAQASGNTITTFVASSSLGRVHEEENQLHLAAEIYRRVLQLARDLPLQVPFYQANLGLARICYEWNDLEAAERYGQQSAELAGHIGKSDEFIPCQLFLARLKLARGDASGAAAMLAQADQFARQKNFNRRLPEIAAAQILVLLRQGSLAAAVELAKQYELPMSRARVLLSQGNPSAALAMLEPLRQQMDEKGWQDERLKGMVLLAIAHHAHGEKDQAAQRLGEALALAEPGGFVRTFVDEGEAMRSLLALLIEKRSRNRDHPLSGYAAKLLAAFTQPLAAPKSGMVEPAARIEPAPLFEALSERELEVLKLLRSELSGPEMAQQLSVSLNTLRTHTKNIFNKLGANNRRAAIRRAEELGFF